MKQKKRNTDLLIFKRWTRKSYAAFSSMHKVVKICAITLGCSFLSLPAKSSSLQLPEDSISQSVELSPIEITADAMLQNDALLTRSLNATISQKQIQSLPVQTLSDILENLPGLDIRQRGPFNTQADISYRGGTFDQTVVLLNGINFSDPQTGHYLLNLPFSSDAIRKIDLFSNTTSYLFGASPFSGMINIITAPVNENSIKLHAMGGDFALRALSVTANLSSKHYRQLITVGRELSDGHIENTDFKHLYGFYHGIADFKAGKFELQAGYTDRAYGANSFYTLAYPDQFDHTKTFISSLRWENKGALRIIPSIYYRRNSDSFELFRGTNKFRNDHITSVFGANLRSFFDSSFGRTSASIDLRVEDVLSNILGEKLPREYPVTGSSELTYKMGKTRGMSGVSLSQSYRYGGLSLNATMLLQQNLLLNIARAGNSEKPFVYTSDKPCLLPALDISYRFATTNLGASEFDFKTTLSASSSVRMPSFLEYYYKSPNILGNVDLKPEKAKTVELANTFLFTDAGNSNKIADGNINTFLRFGEDMIDFMLDPKLVVDKKVWKALNHNKIMFVGLNLGGTLYPQALLGNEFFFTQLTIQYDYLYSDRNSKELLSRYVLDHMQHKFTTKLNHKIIGDFEASWTVSYNKRKGEYEDVNSVVKPYQPFWLLDGRVSYKSDEITLYAEASNIFNVKYFDYGDLLQPGTWIRAGLIYKLDWN